MSTPAPKLVLPPENRWREFVTSIGPALRPVSPVRQRFPLAGGFAPRLAVEWEEPRQAFVSNLRAALARGSSKPIIEIESHFTKRFFVSAALHAGVILAFLQVHPLPPSTATPVADASRYEITYFTGKLLPEIKDAGGAASGLSGKSGGRETLNRPQRIRVIRNDSFAVATVDAPTLQPAADKNVANVLQLLAMPKAGQRPLSALVDTPKHAVTPQSVRRQVAAEVAAPHLRAEKNVHVDIPDAILPTPVIDATVPHPKLEVPMAAVVAPPEPVAADRHNLPQSDWLASRPNVSAPAQPAPPAPAKTESIADAPLIREAGSKLNDLRLQVAHALDVAGPPAPSAGSATGSRAGNSPTGDATVAAVVVSANPGHTLGGGSEGRRSVALGPNGGRDVGSGGIGNGSGISRGRDSGSGKDGAATGAAKIGSGAGAGPAVSPGLSTGGESAGAGNSKLTASAGISISGGAINLPSFAPAVASPHLPLGPRTQPAITIVGNSRSGGGLNRYGLLKGSKVYTIYIPTSAGTAILQYSNAAADKGFDEDLTAPELLSQDLPAVLQGHHLVVSAVISTVGELQDLKVLECSTSAIRQEVMDALRQWRFRPVLTHGEAVAVQVILGFGKDGY